MRSASLRTMLFSIVILLFAICFALSSSGMQIVTFGLAFIGLLVGIYGAFRRQS